MEDVASELFLNDLIAVPCQSQTKWYDYYTFWSAILFAITLLLILIDQLTPKNFLPGWWIAFIFANTIYVGIMGTLIVTVNIDNKINQNSSNRLEYAYSQLFFHTMPLLIAVILLLLFPTILKPFKIWEVVLAFVILTLTYMVVPSSHQKNIFIWKIKEVYYDPDKFLLLATSIAVIALAIFIEKKLLYMYT